MRTLPILVLAALVAGCVEEVAPPRIAEAPANVGDGALHVELRFEDADAYEQLVSAAGGEVVVERGATRYRYVLPAGREVVSVTLTPARSVRVSGEGSACTAHVAGRCAHAVRVVLDPPDAAPGVLTIQTDDAFFASARIARHTETGLAIRPMATRVEASGVTSVAPVGSGEYVLIDPDPAFFATMIDAAYEDVLHGDATDATALGVFDDLQALTFDAHIRSEPDPAALLNLLGLQLADSTLARWAADPASHVDALVALADRLEAAIVFWHPEWDSRRAAVDAQVEAAVFALAEGAALRCGIGECGASEDAARVLDLLDAGYVDDRGLGPWMESLLERCCGPLELEVEGPGAPIARVWGEEGTPVGAMTAHVSRGDLPVAGAPVFLLRDADGSVIRSVQTDVLGEARIVVSAIDPEPVAFGCSSEVVQRYRVATTVDGEQRVSDLVRVRFTNVQVGVAVDYRHESEIALDLPGEHRAVAAWMVGEVSGAPSEDGICAGAWTGAIVRDYSCSWAYGDTAGGWDLVDGAVVGGLDVGLRVVPATLSGVDVARLVGVAVADPCALLEDVTLRGCEDGGDCVVYDGALPTTARGDMERIPWPNVLCGSPLRVGTDETVAWSEDGAALSLHAYVVRSTD